MPRPGPYPVRGGRHWRRHDWGYPVYGGDTSIEDTVVVTDGAPSPTAASIAMGPAPPLHITWQEPMPLDAAIGQPGAGVFIIERAGEGEDAWMPAHVTIAADGFGSRIQLLMDDAQGLGPQPDWGAFRVRLGVLPVRPGHPADRAALHAISRDVAARIRGTEAGTGLAPSPEPTQRQRQLLQERGVQDTGAIPDYLASLPQRE